MTIDVNKKKENAENHKKMMTFGKNIKKINSESSIVSMGLSKIDYEGIGNLTDQHIDEDDF